MKRALVALLGIVACAAPAWLVSQTAAAPEMATESRAATAASTSSDPSQAASANSSPDAPGAEQLKVNATAAPAAASSDPLVIKARHLLDQMVVALGGQAWLSYKTSVQQGRSYSFYHGHPTSAGTQFWHFFEYPDKERRELTKQRDVVYIYNGSKGYEKTYKGTAAAEDKSVQEVLRRRRHSIEVAIREWLRDPRTMLFYDGQSVANRQLVDVVTLLNRDNDQISIGIDVHTHLPVNERYSWRDADRYKLDDEVIFGNYRKVQGIETPFTVTTTRDGEMTGQYFLSHAEYNAAFAPGFFDAKISYDPKHYQPDKK